MNLNAPNLRQTLSPPWKAAGFSNVSPSPRRITPGRRWRRAGASLTELVVAGSVLITATGLVATSAVGSQRLHRQEQQYRVAVDELSNQLERLTLMQEDELKMALEELRVSDWAAQSLTGAVLAGISIDDEQGERVVLTIHWAHIGKAKPLTAVGWMSRRHSFGGREGA